MNRSIVWENESFSHCQNQYQKRLLKFAIKTFSTWFYFSNVWTVFKKNSKIKWNKQTHINVAISQQNTQSRNGTYYAVKPANNFSVFAIKYILYSICYLCQSFLTGISIFCTSIKLSRVFKFRGDFFLQVFNFPIFPQQSRETRN